MIKLSEYIEIDGKSIDLTNIEVKAIEKTYSGKKLSLGQRIINFFSGNEERDESVFLFEKDLRRLLKMKNLLILMNSDLETGTERQKSIYDEKTTEDYFENFNREFDNVQKRFNMLDKRYLKNINSSLLTKLKDFLGKSREVFERSKEILQ